MRKKLLLYILELGWLPKSIQLTMCRFLYCYHQQIQNNTLIFYIDYFDHKIVALDIVKIWHYATSNLIGYTSNKKTWSKRLNNNPILYTLKSTPVFWCFSRGIKWDHFLVAWIKFLVIWFELWVPIFLQVNQLIQFVVI